jgi:hypothetical protein
MVIGTLIAEAGVGGIEGHAQKLPATSAMLLTMVIGMTVGLRCAWLIADWAIRCFSRSPALDPAAFHDPRS